MKQKIIKWYGRVLLIAIILFVVFFISKNLHTLDEYDFEVDYFYIVSAFLAICCAIVIRFLLWIILTAHFKIKAPLLLAGNAYFYSQLGKYIPGKAGLLLTRINAYKKYSKRKITLVTAIEYIACFVAACLTVLLAILITPDVFPSYAIYISSFMVLFLVIILWPPLMLKGINFISKLFKRAPLEISVSYSFLLIVTLCYIVPSLFEGLGLFLVLKSMAVVSTKYFFIIAGTYSAACLIGIAAFFAPSGIGIREGILFLILPVFIPKPAVIVGAILIRLIATVVELFLAFVSYLIYKMKTEIH